jgi:RNA polymerase sigma factor (sigma-70 family)
VFGARPIGRAGMDRRVLEGLFVQHRLRLVRVATAIVLDRATAEEMVQDAFAGLANAKEPIDNPVGYLHRAVVNRSISVVRRRMLIRRQPPPMDVVTYDPEVDETWAHVQRLRPRERAVVVMRYWLDLSENDIAEQLGWPNGTVKSTLHRALNQLRKDLNR